VRYLRFVALELRQVAVLDRRRVRRGLPPRAHRLLRRVGGGGAATKRVSVKDVDG
jgi:hypothetical protein